MKKSIKSDRTLLLTSILLFFMLAAGILSGVLGFVSGHEALKGVTQPDIRPNNNKGGNQQNINTKGLELIQEQELIASMKKQMGVEEPKKDAKQAKDAKQKAAAFEQAVKNDPKTGLPFSKLPIVREDQGISMTIKSIESKGNNVKLELTIANRGSQPVNFGQGISVTNEKSQGISSITNGLPTSLAASGKEANVTLTIAKTALDKVKTVSLQLSDIDKKLQLEASGVPVGK
jgi:LAS superfamily LD-carboxypeptidase LdcB